MGQISLVIGQAGTGKTTWLIEKIKQYAPAIMIAEHHRVLAITRMHGARRRIEMKLRESCPGITCSVTTIDGFALWITNRWRTALGYSKPVHAVSGDMDFADTVFGTVADFARILKAATHILKSTVVSRIIGETYPLIIIDEFQDCHGSLLEFVKALSACSPIFLAADGFQLLEETAAGCPSIEWIKELQLGGAAEVTELTYCHRTSMQSILDAASCLRNNTMANRQTIPVFYCQNEGPAAWKIIDALVLRYYSAPWIGTTALICPSHDPFLYKVLKSCTNQLQKKGYAPIHWYEERSIEKEQERIREDLEFTSTCSYWRAPEMAIDLIGNHIVERTQRFARLRGLQPIPQEVLGRHIDMVVHEKRTYCAQSPSRTVTTVHGAKNREFDNVFILWTYKLPPDQELQRRLLYNAVTRAKENCMLLVFGNVQRVQSDPVLSLLGSPLPAISTKAKTKTLSSKKARK